ncbi:MAG TPA: hypothetical protein VF121_07790 [Thermoanaerobaculia bacterium]|nr:hypothetical protein [Thermoanaerobaculia bacterium]
MKSRSSTLLLVTLGTFLASVLAFSLGPHRLIADSELSRIPMPPERRAPTGLEQARIRAELGSELGNVWIAQHALGISGRLSAADLDHYRSRGTSEAFLLNWIAEYGIGAGEAEVLRAIGVDLAVRRPAEGAGPYHSAAFADIVVLGEVADVVENPAGPYHSSYPIHVAEYLKNCTPASPPVVTGRLLETGARRHGAHIHKVEFAAEPDLAKGETVLVFLARTPFSLIGKLQTPHSAGEMQHLTENYGPVDQLLNEIAAPSGFEVIDAYKIVDENAVWKMRALHLESWHEVVKLDALRDKIRKIGDVQKEFCAARNLPHASEAEP